MSIFEKVILSGAYTYAGGQMLNGMKEIVFERDGLVPIYAYLDLESGGVDLAQFYTSRDAVVSRKASAEFADAISHYWSMI